MASKTLRAKLQEGMVIPAHPLALTAEGKLDERSMRALTRYYLDAGAGGVAVGVHTTQFQIRDASIGLLAPVLELAAETAVEWESRNEGDIVKVAGICGETRQAVAEASLAVEKGYQAGLLSLSAMPLEATTDELIAHVHEVAAVIPVFGFYLQPAVGGRLLPYEFWRRFAEIENVVAIKIAAFNRYQTIDVIRGLCDADAADRIALYTGNDDNIVADLLTSYRIQTEKGPRSARFVGGLLGHWAVWTQSAVRLLGEARRAVQDGAAIDPEWLTRVVEVTDMNAALFDAANAFRGCIPGVHRILSQQGLMEHSRCLDTAEVLSPGQAAELDRVRRAYPHLIDDDFVAENLDQWRR